ncbi:MAG: hypothetical protein H3Z50_06465 [archaeon]|nr:hypothetical protein [archaeon]
MGLFDFIFKKGKKEMTKPLDVPLNKLDAWFDDETKIHFEELDANSKKVLDKIQMLIDQFRDDIESLEEAEIEEEKVDPRLLRIVLGNRISLVKKMRSFIDGINIPAQINCKTILEFHDSFMKMLEDVNIKSVKNYPRTKILFGSEASLLLKDLKILNKLFTELVDPIKEKRELIKDIDETKEDIKDLKEEISSLERNKIDLKGQRFNLERLGKEKSEVRKSLEKLVESEKWAYFSKLVQEKEDIRKEIKGARSEILQTVSPLGKSLKKFKNLMGTEKEKLVSEKELDVYINSPVEALIADGGFETLKSILNNVKKYILSREIELKDKKREKTLASIKEILETDTLKELIKKHNDLVTIVVFLSKAINKIKFEEKEILENKLEEIKRRIKELEGEIQKSNKKNKVLEKRFLDKKFLLENKIEQITNRKVNLILDQN